MLDWRINWMDIKEGLSPAVNVWALRCQDNTADSTLKPLNAFCLWVVFMTGAIFHLSLDRAARMAVAVNLTLICLLFIWGVQRGRCSRSDFSPSKRHFYFSPFTVSVDPGCSTLHKSHEKLWIPINSCFFANFICQNTLHFSPPFRPASSGEAPLFTFLQAVWPLGQGWEQRSGRTSCLIHAGSELSVGSTLKTSLCPFRVPFRSFHLVSSWCQSAITWPLTLLLLIATSTSGRVWKTLAMSRNSNHATQPCHGSPSCCQQDGELLSLMRFIWREREGEWFGFGLVKSVRPFIWLFLTLKYN